MKISRAVVLAWLVALGLVFSGGIDLARAADSLSAGLAVSSGVGSDPAALIAEAERLIQEGQVLMEQGISTNDRLLTRSGMKSIRDGMKIKRALATVEAAVPAAELQQQ
jgi:hypothetical protein